MKLTALFTARRGRNFLANLSAREGRNYQFDFLRPTHSLFGYFNRLVEQYTKIIQPNKEALVQLQERTQNGGRWKTLEVARKHARWEKNKREQDKKRQDDQEAERSTPSRCSSFYPLIDSVFQQLHSPRSTGMTMRSCRQSNSQQPMPIQNFLLL